MPTVQENIKRYHKWACKDNSAYNGAIATMCNFEENDTAGKTAVGGMYYKISNITPDVLKC